MSVFSQKKPILEKLEKMDTIFIYFKHKKNEIIKPSVRKSKGYIFIFDNNHFFKFSYGKYYGLGNRISDIKIKNKCFLRRNRKNIITYKYLKKNVDLLEDIYRIIKKKKFYLIDNKEIKKGKIKLKEVAFFADYFDKI